MIHIEIEEKGRLDLLKTILASAMGSVGSGEYRNLYIEREGYSEDVTYNGEYSCAISTTAMYHRICLLTATHSMVDGFEAEVRATPENWLVIDEPMPGAIGILEGKRHLDGTVKNRHTFICVGGGMAVHNGLEDGVWAPRLCAISSFKHHTSEQRLTEVFFIHRSLIPTPTT